MVCGLNTIRLLAERRDFLCAGVASAVGCGELATGGLTTGGLTTAEGTGVRPAGWPETGALARLVVWDEPGLRP